MLVEVKKMNTKEYQHNYQQEHKAELREKRRVWRQNHLEMRRAQAARYSEKVKQEVLTYYGGGACACVQCGETRVACLTIDHIRGDGAVHRKELRGTRIYVWLRLSHYPEGYQTLCMNCQWIKRKERKEYARPV